MCRCGKKGQVVARIRNLNPNQNEVLLNYKLNQSQRLVSPLTKKHYSISFKNPKIVVDKQDAEWLLGLKRNGRNLFELVQETVNDISPVLEKAKEEKEEVVLKEETNDLQELPVEPTVQQEESEQLLDEIVALEQEQETQKPKGKKKNVSMQSED